MDSTHDSVCARFPKHEYVWTRHDTMAALLTHIDAHVAQDWGGGSKSDPPTRDYGAYMTFEDGTAIVALTYARPPLPVHTDFFVVAPKCKP
jgi:hypothetical protein